MRIKEEKFLPNYEIKKILNNEQEENLLFEQKTTKDIFNKMYDFDDKIYEEVKNALKEKGYSDYVIAVILNTLPEYEEQVKAIFAKERTDVKDEDVKFIIEQVCKLIH